MSGTYSVFCRSLETENCGQYHKILKKGRAVYIKLDENCTPNFSLSFNNLSQRWEMRDLLQKRIIAFNSMKNAGNIEDVSTTWTILDIGSASPKKDYIKLTNADATRQHAGKGRKRANQCSGKRNVKRKFGKSVLQENNNNANAIKPTNTTTAKKRRKTSSGNRVHLVFAENTDPLERTHIPTLACDLDTMDDELFTPVYIQEIMKHFRNIETDSIADPTYMEVTQNDLQSHMRKRLLDWLIQIQERFQIQDRTLHLSVQLLDRYLSIRQVHRGQLQLVGCVCLWIAAKYTEIRVAEISDFVYMSDGAFEAEDMITREADVVNALGFNFSTPTAYSFAERFVHVISYILKGSNNCKHSHLFKHLVNYYLEHCLLLYHFVGKKPSLLAAAATYAAAFWLDRTFEWTDELVTEIGLDETELQPMVDFLKHDIYDNPAKNNIQDSDRTSVFQKYSRTKFGRVAKMRCIRKSSRPPQNRV